MIQTFLHTALSLWMLLSTSGLILNKHFCRNELQKFSLFVEAEDCHRADSSDLCPLHHTASHDNPDHEKENDCCENQTDLFKLDEVKTSETWNVYDGAKLKLLAIALVSIKYYLPSSISFPSFLHYKPPPLVCNLPVRLQTFLL